MKFNFKLGILGSLICSVIALAGWAFMADSPGPHSSNGAFVPRAHCWVSNFVSEIHPRPSGLPNPAEDISPKSWVEAPGVDTLESRCLQLAERDPRAAVILAKDDASISGTHPGLLANIVGQWAAHDLQSSHEWVLQQQPGDLRDDLMARVAFVGSQSDPAAAARIVTDEMTPGQRQIEAAISVLHQWAQRDLNAAAAWASAFPEGPLRQRAMGEIEGTRNYQRTANP